MTINKLIIANIIFFVDFFSVMMDKL
jgi:hypothetical protein